MEPTQQTTAIEPEEAQPHITTLSKPWKRELWRLLWLLLYPLAFFLKELAAANPAFVETVFSQNIYRYISTIVGSAFGWMPFSFVEFLVYVLLALLLAWIIYTIVNAFRRKLKPRRLVHTLITFAIIGGVGINLFYVMWGFNYFRYPVSYSMGLEVKERPPQELAGLCAALAKEANTLRAGLPEDENGDFVYPGGAKQALGEIPAAYAALGEDYAQFSRRFPIPKAKPVLASELMSWAGIAGIYIPFTEEANVNVHQPPLLLASSAAHESAHFMGIAREDEANFISYLACLRSADPAVRYSGVMLALIHAGNALNDISPESYAQLHSYYSDAVSRDLAAHNAYWDRYEGPAEEAVNNMNDNYLKQQKQEDGVMSYGRMVDLMLAYYDQNPYL